MYFKIKKEVEAKEVECKQATRNVEKQMKVIETLTKSEKNLTQLTASSFFTNILLIRFKNLFCQASLEVQLEETKFCLRQCLDQRTDLDKECQETKVASEIGAGSCHLRMLSVVTFVGISFIRS